MPNLNAQDASHDPYAVIRIRDYRLLAAGNFTSNLGTQMLTVALTCELYRRTNSATALGLAVCFKSFRCSCCLSLPDTLSTASAADTSFRFHRA